MSPIRMNAGYAADQPRILLLKIRAATTGEGFRDSCHVTARSASEPEERTHHLLVEVVPSDEDLRAILSRHGLFSKEILIYEEVHRGQRVSEGME